MKHNNKRIVCIKSYKTKAEYLLWAACLFCTNFLHAQPCDNPTPFTGGFGITNVTISNLNNNTPAGEGFTKEYDSTSVPVIEMSRCETYTLTMTTGGNVGTRVWIDWNNDDEFDDLDEFYLIGFQFTNPKIFTIQPPFDTPLDTIIMRVSAGQGFFGGGDNPDACVATTSGDYEDYKIFITEQDMTIDSVIVEQANDCYAPGSIDKAILRIAVHTSGTRNPATIQSFDLNPTGTTTLTDIADAKVYYTGDGLPFFNTTNLFGALGSPPTGSGSITGSQLLTSTSCNNIHYFWLTYDISASAIRGNLIDAECTNITADVQGTVSSFTPTITAPTGSGTIGGVEICNNGIDDDCDGFVDCVDDDCSGIASCISNPNSTFYNLPLSDCVGQPLSVSNGFNLVTEWTNPFIDNFSSPVIGDIDNDNIPEVVTAAGGNIVILNGQTGLLESSIIGGAFSFISPTIGDVDGDGTAEIFVAEQAPDTGLYCFPYNAVNVSGYIWKVRRGGGQLSLADFNGDGDPELYDDRGRMWDAKTGSLLGFPLLTPGGGKPQAADFFPNTYCTNCTGLELLIGREIFAVDISAGVATFTKLAEFPKITTGLFQPAVVDVNGDGFLDIAAMSSSSTFDVWEPSTNSILGTFDLELDATPFIGPGGGLFGGRSFCPPAAADLDNDGEIEFIIAGKNWFGLSGAPVNKVMFCIDDITNNSSSVRMSQKWALEGPYEGSSGLKPNIFDFDGDGNKEVAFLSESNSLIGEQNFLYVINGQTGKVIDSTVLLNNTVGIQIGTQVADVDGDGHVEILACGTTSPTGISLIGEACNKWVCGRQIWNQYNYNGFNINENLTIPRNQQHRGAIPYLNGHNLQFSYTDIVGNIICSMPDVAPEILSFNYISCDTVDVMVEFCNQGKENLPLIGCSDRLVSFYNGDPLNGGNLLLTTSFNNDIDTDTCASGTFRIAIGNQGVDLYVFYNDSGNAPLTAPQSLFAECNTQNNGDSMRINQGIDAMAQVSPNTICLGESVTLQGSGGLVYDWQPDNSLNQQEQNPTATPWETTNYILRVSDSMGCEAWDSVIVYVDSPSTLDLGKDTQVCEANELLLESPIGMDNYLWSTGGTTNSVIVSESNIYYLTIIQGVCKIGDSINVFFCKSIYIPNAFTPNNDGENDIFKINSEGISMLSLRIYNRWGEKVFETRDKNVGWDGISLNNGKTKLANKGVYLYSVTGNYFDGSAINLKGNVTLIR